MADKRLTELSTRSVPASTDLMYVVADGTDYKVETGAVFAAVLEDTATVDFIGDLIGHNSQRVEDFGAVGDDSTDDTAAIQDAIDAAVAAAISDSSFYAEVVFDAAKRYKLSGALVQGGVDQSNSQLTIPWRPGSAGSKIVLVFKSNASFVHAGNTEGETSNNFSGAILRSTLTGLSHSGTYGIPSVIGGPTRLQAGTAGTDFTNFMVCFDGVCVRTPDNPTLTAVNLENVSTAYVGSMRVDTNVDYFSITKCTSPHAYGLRLPQNNNNVAVHVRDLWVQGYFTGLSWSECAQIDWCFTARNNVGLNPQGLTNHGSHISSVWVTDCPYGVSGVNPASGVSAAGVAGIVVDMYSTENNAGGQWALTNHVNDGSNNLRGLINYMRVTSALAEDDLVVSGATGIELNNRGAAYVAPSGGGGGAAAVETIAIGADFTDDFNRANETPLASPYSQLLTQPQFNLATNHAVPAGSDAFALFNSSALDLTLSVTFNVSSNGHSIVLSYDSVSGHWLYFQSNGGGWAVYYMTGVGITTTIATGSGAPASGTVLLQVIASGTTYTFKANGTTLWTGTFGTYARTSTVHGFHSSITGNTVELVEYGSGSSTTAAVDAAVAAYWDVTIASDGSLTLSGATAGEAADLTVVTRQDGSGGHALTLPAATWAGGTPATPSTGPGAVDVYRFLTIDGGSTWQAIQESADMS